MTEPNKELPKEVQDAQLYVSKKYGLGQTLVTGHKASYFNEATIIAISEKDKRIAELEAEVKKVMGLLRWEIYSNAWNEHLDELGIDFEHDKPVKVEKATFEVEKKGFAAIEKFCKEHNLTPLMGKERT